ncbi:MAG: phenylpyruvate tautomerase MIF-related protein [Gammaproteobacteria bacterium]|nr:phenylpyruvate tautomerase MIF-related protein [Gammaproteobacteria bacterium]MCW8923207.1 phenylpyruvate tautomerase MIF-related protein [Gammaproteobacteria bacterium]
MPLLQITTNISVEDSTALAKDASRIVAGMLGKPESYVMVIVNDESSLVFAGSEQAAAHLKLKSLGLDESRTGDYSTHLCGFIQNMLGIEPSRIYIEFSSPERHMWGWDCGTF